MSGFTGELNGFARAVTDGVGGYEWTLSVSESMDLFTSVPGL